jgi:cellulose biosynthesis protein BcsQ
MDPQAQVTQWLGLGDGLSPTGTLVAAMEGKTTMDSIVQQTAFPNLLFVASCQQLEDVGRQITEMEGYQTILTGLLATMKTPIDFVVIDSPNQISPVMENCIYPSDAFVIPFESTKAVRSYANFYALLMRLRPGEDHRVLHVLSNLSRQPGLRRRVIETLTLHRIPQARTEIRTCGWLAQVDENGGNIFAYRPYSKGAADMALLTDELLELLGKGTAQTLSAAGVREIRTEAPDASGGESTVPSYGRSTELSINEQRHDQAA